eukprot:UN06418
MRFYHSKAYFLRRKNFVASSVKSLASRLLMMLIFNLSNMHSITVVGFIL